MRRSRHAALWIFALACLAGGVALMLDDGEPERPAATAIEVAPRLAQPSGTLAPQVTVESAPVVRRARTVGDTRSVTTDQRDNEARRRAQGLREVLENIQGEPVYVEGVDGPARR